MTEVSTNTVDGALEDLDLSAAELNELDVSREDDASGESGEHNMGTTVSLSASFRLPIYNVFQPAIAKLAEEAAGRIRSHSESGRRSVVEIGKELLAMKRKLGHGLFGKWIDAEFDMSAKSAQNYMNLARMAEKSGAVPGLSDTSLQLLAAPGVDAVRDKIIKTITDDINAGKPAPKTKSVKEMISNATGKAKASTKAAPISTPAAATSAPTKAAPAAVPTPPSNSSTTAPPKSDPGEILAPSATNKALTVATAPSTSSPTTPATAEQTVAAARLISMLRNVLPRFAELYDVAGHEVFRKAMADALKAAVTQSQKTKQAA